MDNGYRRLCAAMLNKAADDSKRHNLDAILFLLTDAEKYCDELDFDYQQVFIKAKHWYTKTVISDNGGNISSTFIDTVTSPSDPNGKQIIRRLVPWFHKQIKRVIADSLTNKTA
jgi:hypothetical protein